MDDNDSNKRDRVLSALIWFCVIVGTIVSASYNPFLGGLICLAALIAFMKAH